MSLHAQLGEIDHRTVAVRLFNRSWELLETPDRTPDQDAELLDTVHASRWHWSQVVGAGPAVLARGDWMCATAYAALALGDAALASAQRYVEAAQAWVDAGRPAAGGDGAFEDWDLASALQGLAAAQLACGRRGEAESTATRCRAALATVSDAEDRDLVAAQLDALGL